MNSKAIFKDGWMPNYCLRNMEVHIGQRNESFTGPTVHIYSLKAAIYSHNDRSWKLQATRLDMQIQRKKRFHTLRMQQMKTVIYRTRTDLMAITKDLKWKYYTAMNPTVLTLMTNIH